MEITRASISNPYFIPNVFLKFYISFDTHTSTHTHFTAITAITAYTSLVSM